MQTGRRFVLHNVTFQHLAQVWSRGNGNFHLYIFVLLFPYLRNLCFRKAVPGKKRKSSTQFRFSSSGVVATFCISVLWLRFVPSATVSLVKWPCWPHMDILVSAQCSYTWDTTRTHRGWHEVSSDSTDLMLLSWWSAICDELSPYQRSFQGGNKETHARLGTSCAYITTRLMTRATSLCSAYKV